jgi:hypothetical protein
MHFLHTRADGAILAIGVLVDRAATTARSSDVSVASRSAHRRPRVSDVRLRALLRRHPSPSRSVNVLADSISVSRRQIGAFRKLSTRATAAKWSR